MRLSPLGPLKCVPTDPGGRPLNAPASEFANRLMTGALDTIVFMTGVAVEQLVRQIGRSIPKQRFLDCLTDSTTIAGSPAAADALREFGVTPAVALDSNSTWRDVLIAVDHQSKVTNLNVALEQSSHVHSIAAGLEARGANVFRVPVFATEVPENTNAIQDVFERIDANEFDSILFADPRAAAEFCFLAGQFGRARLTSHLLDRHVVLTSGSGPAELLSDHGVPVDFQTEAVTLQSTIAEVEHKLDDVRQIFQQKHIIRVNMSGPASSSTDTNAPWYNSPFMKACRGEPTDVTPIWMMRQAGRYMKEYRAVRDKVSFLELCANPQLCSEVMCHAVQKLGVDAAIIFSDLLPILVPMGCDLEFVKGDGPVIHNPVRTAADVDRIKPDAQRSAGRHAVDWICRGSVHVGQLHD